MKQKLFFILLLFIGSVGVSSAQGLFQEDEELNPPFESNEDYGGELRALPPLTGDPGQDVPLGEGILILSALAGGYAIIKNRNSKKENTLLNSVLCLFSLCWSLYAVLPVLPIRRSPTFKQRKKQRKSSYFPGWEKAWSVSVPMTYCPLR